MGIKTFGILLSSNAKYFQGSEIRIQTSDQRRLKSERDISCYQCWIVDIKMFPPKRRLSVQLSRHANFMAFLLLWPNKIPISPRSRMLTFNFNAFLTNICVGRLWNMAIYGNRLYFTVPFYTHFFSKVDLSECFHIFLPWCLLLVENVLSKISLQEDDILYTASEPSCSSGICTLVLNIHIHNILHKSELEHIYTK